jgi:CsoR family transcriptional regulator, copper-sensing transcriptional repressor
MAKANASKARGVRCDSGACHVAAGDNGRRKAVAVDEGARTANLSRLRRIEGQVRGLQRMVEEDRYCGDILTQLGAVQEALRSVGKELMRNHLRHCATQAIRSGGEDADAMYDELVELFYKNAR